MIATTIPSRYSNPFATCWTRPGAMPFQFPDGESADTLMARFAASGWRGQILGAHGSGKSTLLATLRPHLEQAPRAIKVIDGFEELLLPTRWRVRAICRLRRWGLLVTAHQPVGLPTLMELCPQAALVKNLVATLVANKASRVSERDIDLSLAHHGPNVREVLFELFNRHESRTRPK